MFVEPWQTRFNRGWLKLCRHHTRGHGGVVNLDDVRQVGLNSIANNHFVRDTVSHREGKLGSIVSFQRSGLMFLNGPSCTGGGKSRGERGVWGGGCRRGPKPKSKRPRRRRPRRHPRTHSKGRCLTPPPRRGPR